MKKAQYPTKLTNTQRHDLMVFLAAAQLAEELFDVYLSGPPTCAGCRGDDCYTCQFNAAQHCDVDEANDVISHFRLDFARRWRIAAPPWMAFQLRRLAPRPLPGRRWHDSLTEIGEFWTGVARRALSDVYDDLPRHSVSLSAAVIAVRWAESSLGANRRKALEPGEFGPVKELVGKMIGPDPEEEGDTHEADGSDESLLSDRQPAGIMAAAAS